MDAVSYLRSVAESYWPGDAEAVSKLRKILGTTQGRVEATARDPLLFMLVYTPHIMKSPETGNVLSINDTNTLLCKQALEWLRPRTTPKAPGLRNAVLAPRSSTKSSTTECNVLWAAAHRHIPYILMFSGSDVQAEKHLSAIVDETRTNKLLQLDYPDFCSPRRNQKNSYKSASHVTIESRSWSSSVLGAKENNLRPQLLILDDISKGEGSGSVYQSSQILESLLGTILPLNDTAPVRYACTNHFIGSVEDDLVKTLAREEHEEVPRWVTEENFDVSWLLPIVTETDGSQRSIWPERWTLEYLQSIQNTRSYQKDFLNLPVPLGAGDWFKADDFIIDVPDAISKWVLSIDPGISSKGDPTGIAVVGFSSSARRAVVYETMAMRLKGPALKAQLLELCSRYADITDVVWEATQGGEFLMAATLGVDFPANVHLVYPKLSKLERAEILLTRYRRKQITHARPLPAYIAECSMLPKMPHSPNQVDAVGQAVEWLGKVGRTTSVRSTVR